MCITRVESGTATYRNILSVMELPKPDHQPPVMLDGMEQERYVVKSRFRLDAIGSIHICMDLPFSNTLILFTFFGMSRDLDTFIVLIVGNFVSSFPHTCWGPFTARHYTTRDCSARDTLMFAHCERYDQHLFLCPFFLNRVK